MKRYAVCPQSPGNMWWQAFGHNSHLQGVSSPVKEFATAKGAKNYAKKRANDFDYGLVVVDTDKELVDWGGSPALAWEKPGQDEE